MTATIPNTQIVEAPKTPTRRNDVNVWLVLLGVALIAAGFIVPLERAATYTAWSAGCVLFNIYTVYFLFARRIFLFSTLLLFLTYGVTIVWVPNYLIQAPMSSWRAGWESRDIFPQVLGASIQYLSFLSVLLLIASSFLPAHRERAYAPLGSSYRIPVAVLTGLAGTALVGVAGTQARDQYLIDADIGSQFVVQASSIMLSALFAFTLFFVSRGKFRNSIAALLVAIALIVGLNGFRFLLIIVAFITLFYVLSVRKLSTRSACALAAASVLGYFFLLILAYTRSIGMTFGGALTFAFNPDFGAAYGYVGASDQTNLIAQDYYSEQSTAPLLNGQTYLDAFFRLAPNIVHTTYFDTIRSQDYIIQTGSFVPAVFRQNNWTIGSQLFVEAIINFGKAGPYIVLSALVLALTFLEKLARRSNALFLGYLGAASMAYSLAWYGFANSLKQTLFAFICGWIIIMSGKVAVNRNLPRLRGGGRI